MTENEINEKLIKFLEDKIKILEKIIALKVYYQINTNKLGQNKMENHNDEDFHPDYNKMQGTVGFAKKGEQTEVKVDSHRIYTLSDLEEVIERTRSEVHGIPISQIAIAFRKKFDDAEMRAFISQLQSNLD